MTKRLYTLTAMILTLEASSLRTLKREEGQTLAEYALILALVALFVTGAIIFLRGQIDSLFSKIGSQI